MQNLDECRKELDRIQTEMARLFCERMYVVQEVAAYKKENGLPILDEKREAKILENCVNTVKDTHLQAYYRQFTQTVLDLSRQYQHRLLDGQKIACCGVEGAYAHIAATKIFPDATVQFCESFHAAYQAVEDGDCDCCVLPLENSYAGEVTQVTDLLFSGSLYINGVYDLEICHHLLGLAGARLTDIQTVYSHPQALSQCEGYLHANGLKAIPAENTAMAAQQVAEQNDPHVAAIASAKTADLYGLQILDHDINESNQNTTRFAVFSRAQCARKSADSTFILLFTVRHEAGALADAIRIIGAHGFNMRVLRSRPVKDEPWQYYFYVEATGNAFGDAGKAMLRELSKKCDRVKIAGSYQREETL